MIRLGRIGHKTSYAILLRRNGRQNVQRLFYLGIRTLQLLTTPIPTTFFGVTRGFIAGLRTNCTVGGVLIRYLFALEIGGAPTGGPTGAPIVGIHVQFKKHFSSV